MPESDPYPSPPLSPETMGGTAEELLPRIYDELRRLARQQMGAEGGMQTLTATALVHEAWERLSRETNLQWQGRRHFYFAAARTMRWILLERARKRMAQKRGGSLEKVDLEVSQIPAPMEDEKLLAVHESLTRFAKVDPVAAEYLQLRYYGGLTWRDMAEVTGVSVRILMQDCNYAMAWIKADMGGEL